jgi:uncharacterized protein YkwD/uncharacterized membrane protein required for colicin V production
MYMMFNWIDIVIIVVVLYQGYVGWRSGLVYLGTSLLSLGLSLWLAIVANPYVSGFITEKFGIALSWSTVAGYIIVAIAAQTAIAEILHVGVTRLPDKWMKSQFNSWLGASISAVNGLIVIAFFLLILMALPIRGTIKKDIRGSVMGNFIVNVSDRYGGPIKTTLDEMGKAATRFITVSPSSKETIILDVAPKTTDVFIDEKAEKRMVELVNNERIKAGVAPLTVNVTITNVARNFSKDMFLRRFFSHVNLEGKTPGDRLTAGSVQYTIAGENIAYAPGVDIAHTGLMDSPEHRKNILDPAFKRIGIGIVATESFGIMVTQDFTD